MNEKTYHEAISKAVETHAEAEQALAEAMAQEGKLIERVQALQLRKTEIESEIQKAHDSLVDALVAGSSDTPSEAARLHAELAAVNDAIDRFPQMLADVRDLCNRRTGQVMIAAKNVGSAKFELARFKYRAAMKDVWPLAQEVLDLSMNVVALHELAGMADPKSHRFGILPEAGQ